MLGPASVGTLSRQTTKARPEPGLARIGAASGDVLRNAAIPPRGLEPSANSLDNSTNPASGGAESGALALQTFPIDPALAALIDAWPTLPEAIRAGIQAMVRAAGG
jgi:hypothetical protein